MRLESKTALVTGGASGLGYASAKRFAQEGARVAILDLDGEAAARAAETFGGIGLAADVTDEAALAAAVETIGPVDVLYANAGIPGEGRAERALARGVAAVIAVNLTGVFSRRGRSSPACSSAARARSAAVERRWPRRRRVTCPPTPRPRAA